jgi:peptide/nickel transport system permease protein
MSDVAQAHRGEALVDIGAARRSAWRVVLHGLLRRKGALAGLTGLCVIVLLAVLAPLAAPHDPMEQNIEATLAGPFWADNGNVEFLLGTDAVGRDLASRLIYGARYSLAISAAAVLIGSLLGLVTGVAAGFYGGLVDSALMRLGDIQLAFPFILLAIAILGVLPDRTPLHLIGVLGIPSWIIYARVVRSRVLSERKKDYVTAARGLGASNYRLLRRYILPSVWQVILVIALLDLGWLVIVESTLSFLGFGLPPPTPSWGSILADARQFVVVSPWLAILPGLAILTTVLSINLVADGLADILDPRLARGVFRRHVLTSGPLETEAGQVPLLRVRDLRVEFPGDHEAVRAVRGVGFDLHRGRTLGIVGESASGKSVTALSIVQLLDPPGRIANGQILFDGRDLARIDDREMAVLRGRRIGMIFQNPTSSLNPVLAVGYQMSETIQRHQSLDRSRAREVAAEALLSVGIGNPDRIMQRYPFQLSGGMNQRVMIALAMTIKPDLLIADEPTTALDVTTQAEILDELRAITQRHDTSLVFITHDIALVAEYSDEILVMYAGQVCEYGPVDAVVNDARHPYTRALLESVPRVEVRARERLKAIGGELPDPTKVPEGCPFATRCPEVMDVCWDVNPRHAQIADDHKAACHLWLPERSEAVSH